MSTIEHDLAQIRQAVYGREVREAIADGIEHCYDDVSTSTTLADGAAERANTAAARSEDINEELGDNADALVLVQDTQPVEEFNKLWIKPGSEEYQVPTYGEFEDLEEEVTELKGAINGWGGGTRDVTSEVEWSSTAGGVNYPNGTIVLSITTYSNADIPLNGATHVEGHTRAGLEPEKAMGFFDSDDTWIPGSYNEGGSSYDWDYSLDVPEGAVTLRLCCATSYISAFTCILTLPASEGIISRVEDLEEKCTDDYTDLSNKPQVNNVELTGNKTSQDLGVATEESVNTLSIKIDGGETDVTTEVSLSSLTKANFRIMSNGYYTSQNNAGYCVPITSDMEKISIKGNASKTSYYAFLSSYEPSNGSKAAIIGNSGNPTTITSGSTVTESVPATATYLFIGRLDGNGYSIDPQVFNTIKTEDVKGLIEKVKEIESGASVSYTGSYFQIREGNFKAGSVWRLLFTDTSASYVEITALTDASDTSTAETQFLLYKDEEALWSPLKNYEAIRYGVNGSCKLTINDCSSIYDKIERKVFYCGASRKYTKLIDAIKEAEKYMGSVLYVDAGTYDLVTEFGADYFSGITSADSMPGIVLKNRIHIIFSPNSRVVCNYTGDNQYVLQNFSPFNAGQYGFILENLNLSSSRTRYAIHDERNGKTEQCVSKYINCNIKQDNSGNASWGSYCTIGGGLGANHEVVIENCTFESVPRSGTTVHGTVSYHPSNNGSSTDFACELVVKNSYFKTGTIELSGSRTDAQNDTTVIITGNSFEYDAANASTGIYYSGNQSYQGTHYNVYAWNNEIRQS